MFTYGFEINKRLKKLINYIILKGTSKRVINFRTIFKGLKRYIAPVDESITYTMDQLLQKKAHDQYFLDYIRGTAAVSVYRRRVSCFFFKLTNKFLIFLHTAAICYRILFVVSHYLRVSEYYKTTFIY